MVVHPLPTPPLQILRSLPPPLSSSAHKGQAGKIGVLGGCADYTGAPYYAAIAALKLGCDLSHVFCSAAAAPPLKSYSPELIVHGCLCEGSPPSAAAVEQQAEAVERWLPALSALVVGPGLGRDPTLHAVAARVLAAASARGLPCVVDADGLRLVADAPQLVRGRRWTVLTPNAPEYARLLARFLPEGGEIADERARHLALSAALGGAVVVRKGGEDLLSDGESLVVNAEAGSAKRSGGQGDVLAGTTATFLSWAKAAEEAGRLPAAGVAAPLLAAYAGCFLTRRLSAAAFARHKRAMTAPDLIEAIGPVFEELCPVDLQE
ncbi:hypothetical protein AB1Y20_011345 [Prymnesium parvum]|uniref:ATP-dependent (S)-NAD(P)H-hydrate dehydratase n=1 Tax=Prymnesium parvum TaxID=97485 RepID=A0AB34IPV7_PRYPA